MNIKPCPCGGLLASVDDLIVVGIYLFMLLAVVNGILNLEILPTLIQTVMSEKN